MDERSKILRFRRFQWESVEVEPYKGPDTPFKDVTRQTLLGEGRGEESFNFITRYFEIQPGGYSTLERHQHPHAVIVLRGTGRVILGERTYEIAPFDCVYVSPGVHHQFQATGHEPLGFLCTVDRVRDRPEVASEDAARALRQS